MKLTTIRKYAMALPEVTQEPHHHFDSFRVRGKIFVTVPPDQEHIHVFLGEQQREQALAAYPEFAQQLLWGAKVVGIRLDLAIAPAPAVELLVRQAWENKAPKALVQARTKESSRPSGSLAGGVDEPKLTFATQAAWEAWLEGNGSIAPGVWLRLAKKSAGEPTVSYAQALEGALCHGWIDGQKQPEDQHHWLQRFTPRTARSSWSRINKERAEALVSAGRMRPAGLAAIERAKLDGRWDAAYASAGTSTVPDDLQQALDADQRAGRFFAALDSRNRYAILFRIQNARKAGTRAKKIAQFVEMLGKGEKLYP